MKASSGESYLKNKIYMLQTCKVVLIVFVNVCSRLATAEDRLKVSERERESVSEHLQTARQQLTLLQQRYDELQQKEKELTLQVRELQSKNGKFVKHTG